jgi:hypothetical protein
MIHRKPHPAGNRQALPARGHQPEVPGDFSISMSGGQAVVHDSATGVSWSASDPRQDGAAVPEPAPYYPMPGKQGVPARNPVKRTLSTLKHPGGLVKRTEGPYTAINGPWAGPFG